MARDREYLVVSYGPDCLSTASQMNRLFATLEEVSRKVSLAVTDGLPSQPICSQPLSPQGRETIGQPYERTAETGL
jgi:hypothetical protein